MKMKGGGGEIFWMMSSVDGKRPYFTSQFQVARPPTSPLHNYRNVAPQSPGAQCLKTRRTASSHTTVSSSSPKAVNHL